ncbi:flagellar basal body rod C-terminal domain-containing protein [Brevundimonas faecalis]|uniref:flagellar basal body rod C-terminal domain-containing protein n=1 Tax=Brevundimonas faecalis TaxID=947378 RepID=UPI00360DF0BA
MMIPPLSIAAAGMQDAAARFETSARRVASGAMDDYAVEAVEQIRAKQDFTANAAVVRTADEMTGTLLDILA